MKGNASRSGGVVIHCLIMLLAMAAMAGADDCKKARDMYARGTALLNYEERLSVFQEAVRLCPSLAEAHCNMADACENLAALSRDDAGKFNQLLDRAVAGYHQALACNPRLFSAHLGLGDTYRVMGLYEQSERAYRNALAIKPDHPKAMTGLEKISRIRAEDRGGFKTSGDIVAHFKASSTQTELGSLMGFENRTVVKDRLRFDNILFNEWSAELKRGEAIRQLEELGNAVTSAELSGCDFVVEGHTDNRGDYDRNMNLSRERAESVKAHLVEKFRLNPSRVKTQGFGYSRPKFANDTDENRLKNRRVEIMFVENPESRDTR